MSASNVDSIALALIENNPIRQFVANPNSRVAAIKAKCAECMGCTPDHMERGFRASISPVRHTPAHCIGFVLINGKNLWKAKKRLFRTYDRQGGESWQVEVLR